MEQYTAACNNMDLSHKKNVDKNTKCNLGMVALVYNPSTLKAEAGSSQV
jgi:hypothetical protein